MENKEPKKEKKVIKVDMTDYRDTYYYDDGSVEVYRYSD